MQPYQPKNAKCSAESSTAVAELSMSWLALRLGDREAFLNLYDQCYDVMHGFGRRLINNTNTIEDAIQDTFLELWDKRSSLPEVKFVKAYLLKILKRKLLRVASSAPGSLEACEALRGAADDCIEDMIIEQESNDAVASRLKYALAKLTKRQREIIGLKFFGDLSYEEIAAFTGLSQQRIYNLAHDAVRHLRSSLTAISRHVALVCFVINIF